ncbi:MAG: NAD-dependent epimerase/dehydratase family protein, partial [Planctomycetota bacterium]
MNPKKIYVAGHTGLVGSAVVDALQAEGYDQILTSDHSSVDLTSPSAA